MSQLFGELIGEYLPLADFLVSEVTDVRVRKIRSIINLQRFALRAAVKLT